MLFRRSSRDLPVEKTLILEKALLESELSKIGYMCTDTHLASQFGLNIIVDDELPKDIEAVLDKPTEETYNGTIRVKSQYRDNKFSCIHEIVHYIFDVGIGNTVTKRFARNVTGKTKDPREQEINYLTAAYQLPYDKIYKELKEFNKSYPKDELKFIYGLCETYNQPQAAVLRRVREVKRIASARKQKI